MITIVIIPPPLFILIVAQSLAACMQMRWVMSRKRHREREGGGWGGSRERQFLCLWTIKRTTHPHSLYWHLVCVCGVLVGGKRGMRWGGFVAVMCLTDIEDNCPLSSSCLCNSTVAAAWTVLTWAEEEGKADTVGVLQRASGGGVLVCLVKRRSRAPYLLLFVKKKSVFYFFFAECW